MGRFAIRGLLSRKLRTALTAIAIVLGVAMISGTFVLTDSIDQAFDRIFTDIRQGSNAVISGKSAFDLGEQTGSTAPPLDESLLPQVRDLPGVAEAEGSVDSDATQFIGDDGKAVVFGGAPNLGFSIAERRLGLQPADARRGRVARSERGRGRQGDGGQGGLRGRGDRRRPGRGPVQRMRVSAIVQFSSGLTIGGATLAGFDLPTAQRLFKKVGQLDEIAVAAKPNVTDGELVRQIEAFLPRTAQVRTGSEQAASDAAETNEFISFLRTFLLAFGGIALFVGSFVIANSLSITIAQRTREFATLRTIGATNRQILGSVIVEALVVGVVASVVGLFLGLLLAKGLFELFDAGRLHPSEHGARLRAAHDRRRSRGRDPRDAARERLPGLPRDDGAADRGGARGRCPPGRAARPHPQALRSLPRSARVGPRSASWRSARSR